jgi:hypothetical protein
MADWKKGDPIPEKYRDTMYEWEGGGYDGCVWEPNFGFVGADGHWRPFHSTGRMGIDCDVWHDSELRALKDRHGFEGGKYGRGENVEAWWSSLRECARREALEKVYGPHPFENRDYYDPDPKDGETHFPDRREDEVESLFEARIAGPRERYKAFCAERDALDREWRERMDGKFMEAAAERDGLEIGSSDGWSGVYPMDEGHAKASCEALFLRHSRNPGLAAGVLDRLADYGCEVWGTCSDCGAQFRLSDYERFEDLLDQDSYHGDGGIGIVLTRLLCEDCRRGVECPRCFGLNLPNRAVVEPGHEYDDVYFRQEFVMKRTGVCAECADSFLHAHPEWREEIDDLETRIDGSRAEERKYYAAMEAQGADVDALKAKYGARAEADRVEMEEDLWARVRPDAEEFFKDDFVEVL